MKTTCFFILFLLLRHSLHAQDISQDITVAFRNGNSAGMAKYFDASVDLSIPKSEGVFSKAQAELILKNFFTSSAPQSFNVLHQGNAKDGSKYMIGSMKTASATWRTYVYLKNQSGKFFIHQLRIDPEEKE